MCTAMELLIHSRRYGQTKRERKRQREKKKLIIMYTATELLIQLRRYEQTKIERERRERGREKREKEKTETETERGRDNGVEGRIQFSQTSIMKLPSSRLVFIMDFFPSPL